MYRVRATIPVTVAALAMGIVAHALPGRAADIEANTTGLPTYPRLRHAVMDPVLRSTLGRQCTHFVAESGDPLEVVEAWYRKALPAAVETDVNADPIYGRYFKLTGIRLTQGSDFLTVYRAANGRLTSIELFKCSTA